MTPITLPTVSQMYKWPLHLTYRVTIKSDDMQKLI